MKCIILKLSCFLAFGLFSFVNADPAPVACSKCEPGKVDCPKGSGGEGNCEWEGGILCTGNGTCPVGDDHGSGVLPDLTNKNATCEADDSDTCERRFGPSIGFRCSVRCQIVPFVSCTCATDGNKINGTATWDQNSCIR